MPHLSLTAALLAFTSCAAPAPQAPTDLHPYAPGSPASITPQIEATTRRHDYALRYVTTPDGSAIETRFLGPSESLGAPLAQRTETEGDWHRLITFVPRTDFEVVLAQWQLDATGVITNAYVRTEPFIEWRSLGTEPGQLVSSVEWRPLVDGEGVGEWRRQ